MLIVDSHLDLGWNALQWNRDLRQSAYTIRAQEAGVTGPGRGQGTVALPELQRGRIALCFATTLARATGRPVPGMDYLSPAQAYAAAQGHLAYYRALEQHGHLRVITTQEQLDLHIGAWQAWDSREETSLVEAPPIGVMFAMESADPILQPSDVAAWWDAGVRMIGPAHYGPGRYAGGTGTELGFSLEGDALLTAMERAGVILDLTHLSDQAFWQAMERFHGAVAASHNNCRALVPHQRQFDDAQIRAIVTRDGVIGVAFDTWMMQFGWVTGGAANPRVPLQRIVDHIDHICQIAGSSKHVAIGSDLDGGFGREQSPHDLDTIADLQRLCELLPRRGYSDADVAAILHGNWLGLLRRAWTR